MPAAKGKAQKLEEALVKQCHCKFKMYLYYKDCFVQSVDPQTSHIHSTPRRHKFPSSFVCIHHEDRII